MDKHTIAEVLASMSITEFRQFKRALAILHRSHVTTLDAIELLASAHVRRTRFTRQNRELDTQDRMVQREMSHYKGA